MKGYIYILLATMLSIGVLVSCNKLLPSYCEDNGAMFDANDNSFLDLPNALSPNSDGVNDVWMPIHNGLVSLETSIYNERHDLVFKSSRLEVSWTPDALPPTGMYKFYASVKATSTSGKTVERCLPIYAYFCTQKKNEVLNSSLLFPDQIDATHPKVYLPTNENLKNCN